MTTLSRLSFCITSAEEKALEVARCRLAQQGKLVNQSEVIRAAIGLLIKADDTELEKAAIAITRLKPGRKRRRLTSDTTTA